MNINQLHNIYFIGIGGIGMSALARYYKGIGKNVVGYDKTETDLTKELQSIGIEVHYNDDIANIPTSFKVDNTLVVITPAVPKSHTEWNYFIDHQYTIKKRAEVLGLITKDTFCFAVAGTHGKTTTSSILAHILFQSGVDVMSFLGGIVENYNSNLIGNGKSVTVVEADEFDRSFLHLHPDMACITSMDADHLDIYGDAASIEATFSEFADKIQDKSKLFITKDLPLEGLKVAVNEAADYQILNVKIIDGLYQFDIQTPTELLANFEFALPGKHNLMNALMAVAMAYTYGVEVSKIRKALSDFKGIKRRFSYQIRKNNLVYIDDYAHHPTEINAVHQAVRELYPNQKVLAIFQPHLFSRTQDFGSEFAASLSAFDEVLLLDIYPARELPIEGITSKWLLDQMTLVNKKIIAKNELIDSVLKSDATVFVTIGAGDIGEWVQPIKIALNGKE